MREFGEELDALERICREWREQIMFCGDFNAKSPAWGARTTDRRGAALLELIVRLYLYPIKAGGCPYTFMNGRGNTSVLDFTFCDAATCRRVMNSEVLTEEARSDHLYVVHALDTPEPSRMPPSFKWNAKTLDVTKVKEAYDGKVADLHADRQ